jgi:gluconolactonase
VTRRLRGADIAFKALLFGVVVALPGARVGSAQEQTPSIERLDPALDAIISPQAKFEPLKTDYFGFLEGPVWVPEGRSGYLLFSDVPANRIYKWDGKLSVWMERSGYTGRDSASVGMELNNGRMEVIALGSNGLTLDREGRLVFCTHGDRAVKRRERDGTITVLAERFEGKRFGGPNDIVVRSDGTIYFTDLFGGLRGGPNAAAARELPYGFYLIKDGKVQLLDRDPVGDADTRVGLPANGLAFSPDEKYLYVGAGRDIFRYDVRADGTVANRRLHIHMNGAETGASDGMKVDRAGNVFAVGPGGIWIISAEGKQLGRLHIAGANLAFGDADSKTLYIAARRDLYSIRVNVPGIRPVPNGAQ